MKKGLPLTVLLDEGVPVAMAQPFAACGHRVIHHREVLLPGAPDARVAAMAILNNAALIAQDADLKQMTRRYGTPTDAWRFQNLCLIFVACDAVMAMKRAGHLMSFIEHEWQVACEKTARTMWVEIGTHYLRSYR